MSPKTPITVLALTLAACGSVPKRTFDFRAIDTDEQPVTCLIVVGDQWDEAAEKHQVFDGRSPLRVEIEFPQPSVDIVAIQVAVDDHGKLIAVPRSRSSPSDYFTEVRTVGLQDPPEQLFILDRR